MPTPEIERKIAEELGQNPFGDVESPRSATWAALGVTWTIQSGADRDSWLATLELAATLQITQVDFADADLLIIPSSVFLDVHVADVDKPEIFQLPDNGRLAWRVAMPKRYRQDAEFDEVVMHVASIAIAILGQTTALTLEAFEGLVHARFQRGLAHRLASVRPARELMNFAQPEGFELGRLATVSKFVLGHTIKPIEADELAWRAWAWL